MKEPTPIQFIFIKNFYNNLFSIIVYLFFIFITFTLEARSEENCYFFFSKEFDAMKMYPAIFDPENNFDRVIRQRNDLYRDKEGSPKIIFAADLTKVADESEINMEFQITSGFYAPNLGYHQENASEVTLDDLKDDDVLITSYPIGSESKWKPFLKSWDTVHVSSVPGCRVSREISNHVVGRTLVEVNPDLAPYKGKICVRAGIYMAFGLNNLPVLMGEKFNTVLNGKHVFLYTRPTGVLAIAIPEVHPGMSISKFEKVGRSHACNN